ncbi:MAG TPA: AAA family ATPase [Pyrinomonadaceae bacterium]|nr:AAA family ATPase [Pyrinomonadaceae bacterium]
MLNTKVIAVCGQIGSGKSSIIRELSKSYAWDTVSFGAYIKSQIAADHPTRTDYQTLGEMLFATRGPKGLLEDAIKFSNPSSDSLLIDGVRHVSILSELRKIYNDPIVIFLEVVDRVRYERFTGRDKTEPTMSYAKFLDMCRHPIEQGIVAISEIADIVIDANRDFAAVLAEIIAQLDERIQIRPS